MKAAPFSLRRFARVFPNSHARWYVAVKVASDPLYPAVLKVLRGTAAPLLDLGCGMGVLSFYLRAHGFNNTIQGVDYDPRKIAAAHHVQQATGAPGLLFSVGDARAGLPAGASAWPKRPTSRSSAIAMRIIIARSCSRLHSSSGRLLSTRSPRGSDQWSVPVQYPSSTSVRSGSSPA